MARHGKPWDSGYGFRSGDFRETPSRDRPAAGDLPSEMRECARGEWCSDPRATITSNGPVLNPALCYRAFCDRDRDVILTRLKELPGLYQALQAELTKASHSEPEVRSPLGPAVPLRTSIDTAMRLMADSLGAWESRVRSVARLRLNSFRPHDIETVALAVRVLAGHINALLALQPAWMSHSFPIAPGRPTPTLQLRFRTCSQPGCPECARRITPPVKAALVEQFGDAEIIRVGADFVTIRVRQDGATAGLELLHVHYRARAALGLTNRKPEDLLGVACWNCNLRLLRRADAPLRDGDELWYSQCKGCSHRMTEPEYRQHVEWLAAQHGGRRLTPVLEG